MNKKSIFLKPNKAIYKEDKVYKIEKFIDNLFE